MDGEVSRTLDTELYEKTIPTLNLYGFSPVVVKNNPPNFCCSFVIRGKMRGGEFELLKIC